jgi:hypothetical protein
MEVDPDPSDCPGARGNGDGGGLPWLILSDLVMRNAIARMICLLDINPSLREYVTHTAFLEDESVPDKKFLCFFLRTLF